MSEPSSRLGATASDVGGFSTTYRSSDPAFDTTVWDDCQVALGNKQAPEKKKCAPSIVNAAVRPAHDDVDNAKTRAAAADAADDEWWRSDSDDEEDARAVARFREERIKQMTAKHQDLLVGPVTRESYQQTVTDASRDNHTVVLCMLRKKTGEEEVFDDDDYVAALRRLADEYRATTFAWGDVDALVGPEFPQAHVPCLLVYRETDVAATLTGRASISLPADAVGESVVADAVVRAIGSFAQARGETWLLRR